MKTKPLDASETRSANVAIKELSTSHLPTKAGVAFHADQGAALHGVDIEKYKGAFQRELKTHYTRYLDPQAILDASKQSFGYSVKYQLAPETKGLVPIRQVSHYMLNPQIFPGGLRIDTH